MQLGSTSENLQVWPCTFCYLHLNFYFSRCNVILVCGMVKWVKLHLCIPHVYMSMRSKQDMVLMLVAILEKNALFSRRYIYMFLKNPLTCSLNIYVFAPLSVKFHNTAFLQHSHYVMLSWAISWGDWCHQLLNCGHCSRCCIIDH